MAARRLAKAAVSAGNLSELELTLGDVAEAMAEAERSVTYADHSGDACRAEVNRTTYADALHQSGLRVEAEAYFREAEQMQNERQPDYPLLYSVQGFQVLRSAPRRARARHVADCRMHKVRRPKAEIRTQSRVERCRAVLSARRRHSSGSSVVPIRLLDFALDHLTLGRVIIYAAILTNSKLETAARN